MYKNYEEIKKAEKQNNQIIKVIGVVLGFSFLIIVLEIIKNI
jgi:hypothetical protein